jgi:hypothetical protein
MHKSIIKQQIKLEQYHSKKHLTEKLAWFMMLNATFNNFSVLSWQPNRKDYSSNKLSDKILFQPMISGKIN